MVVVASRVFGGFGGANGGGGTAATGPDGGAGGTGSGPGNHTRIMMVDLVIIGIMVLI